MPEFKLRRLLEANRLAVEHLDLPTALRQIIEASLELVGAAYGAIGVLGPNGQLAEFIHVGMDDETVSGIGSPHPVLNSFLGVPLEVRGEVFGHLYLADQGRDAFSVDDQDLVEALAATAGVAISHARLFEETKRREQWTAATSRITRELLTNDDVDALQLIAETVLGLADADLVVVVLADGGSWVDEDLVVERAAGLHGPLVLGSVLTPDTLIHRCLESQRPQLEEDLGADRVSVNLGREHLGPAMAVPLPAEDGVRGCLVVLRSEGSLPFTEFDLDVAASLASHAALALARDLHDHVIQRLFAAGLNIQGVCAMLGPGVANDRLNDHVDEIDATIRQIRSTVFGLHTTRNRTVGACAMILDVITAATATLPGPPEVSFRGPIDLLVISGLRDDVVAVVREALTNVGRHAAAERVEVFVDSRCPARRGRGSRRWQGSGRRHDPQRSRQPERPRRCLGRHVRDRVPDRSGHPTALDGATGPCRHDSARTFRPRLRGDSPVNQCPTPLRAC